MTEDAAREKERKELSDILAGKGLTIENNILSPAAIRELVGTGLYTMAEIKTLGFELPPETVQPAEPKRVRDSEELLAQITSPLCQLGEELGINVNAEKYLPPTEDGPYDSAALASDVLRAHKDLIENLSGYIERIAVTYGIKPGDFLREEGVDYLAMAETVQTTMGNTRDYITFIAKALGIEEKPDVDIVQRVLAIQEKCIELKDLEQRLDQEHTDALADQQKLYVDRLVNLARAVGNSLGLDPNSYMREGMPDSQTFCADMGKKINEFKEAKNALGQIFVKWGLDPADSKYSKDGQYDVEAVVRGVEEKQKIPQEQINQYELEKANLLGEKERLEASSSSLEAYNAKLTKEITDLTEKHKGELKNLEDRPGKQKADELAQINSKYQLDLKIKTEEHNTALEQEKLASQQAREEAANAKGAEADLKRKFENEKRELAEKYKLDLKTAEAGYNASIEQEKNKLAEGYNANIQILIEEHKGKLDGLEKKLEQKKAEAERISKEQELKEKELVRANAREQYYKETDKKLEILIKYKELGSPESISEDLARLKKTEEKVNALDKECDELTKMLEKYAELGTPEGIAKRLERR